MRLNDTSIHGRVLRLMLPRAARTWLVVRPMATIAAAAAGMSRDMTSVATSVWVLAACAVMALAEERTRLREAVFLRNIGLPGWYGVVPVLGVAGVAEAIVLLVRAGLGR